MVEGAQFCSLLRSLTISLFRDRLGDISENHLPMNKFTITILILVLIVIAIAVAAVVIMKSVDHPQENNQVVEDSIGNNQISWIANQEENQVDEVNGEETITSPEVDSSEIDTNDWAEYTNAKLGISFFYPKDLGRVEERIFDRASCKEGNDISSVRCQHITLFFPEISENSHFFATYGADFKPIGRGGYWGDAAGKITSTQDIKNFCEDKDKNRCKIYTTEQGLFVARYEAYIPFGGPNEEEFITYYIFPENPVFLGFVLSTDRLKRAGVENAEEVMEELVNTLSIAK